MKRLLAVALLAGLAAASGAVPAAAQGAKRSGGDAVLHRPEFLELSERIWHLVRDQAVAATRGAHR